MSGSVSANATASSKVMSDQRRLAVVGIAGRAGPSRAGRRGGSSSDPVRPAIRDAARRLTPAEPEGQSGGDRGRAEYQAERQHHDLIGQTHKGQADRREQRDDGIADKRLRIAAFARAAPNQVGDDSRQEYAGDDDQRAEDHLAAEFRDLDQENGDR